jgi:arginyl-tRNA--protein-N-Asp/Glu arginylyltransferase
MRIPKTTLTTEQVEFKTTRDVVRALQSNQSLTVDVKEITNSTEYQTLLRHLASIKQPFGICVARAKETK